MPRKNRSFNTVQQPIGADNVGHKMLEKMGWTNGLGLGKNNQGNPDILKIREKHNTSGLRCKNEGPASLPHQTAFEDLLGKLSSSNEEMSIGLNSPLETKIYRRTPRYKKMANAKDVTNYAEKDLQGILGSDASKSTCTNESKVPQGCIPKILNLYHNKPRATYDNMKCQSNASPRFDSSEMDNDSTCFKYSSREFTCTKREKRKKYDLEASNDCLGTENNTSEEQDNSSVGIWESKKKRRRGKEFTPSNRKDLSAHDEGKLISYDSESFGQRNGTLHALTTKSTLSKNSTSINDTYLEHGDVLANTCKSGSLGNSSVDNSIEYEKETSNDIKPKQSRVKKSIVKGNKSNRSIVKPVKSLCMLDEKSESESSEIAKPVRYHIEDYDEDGEWKQKILSSPALLEELCSKFVGSNLHKIKGYGNW